MAICNNHKYGGDSVPEAKIVHKRGVWTDDVKKKLKDGEVFFDVSEEHGIWMGVQDLETGKVKAAHIAVSPGELEAAVSEVTGGIEDDVKELQKDVQDINHNMGDLNERVTSTDKLVDALGKRIDDVKDFATTVDEKADHLQKDVEDLQDALGEVKKAGVVRYDVPQSLTAAQQEIARNNIGANAVADVTSKDISKESANDYSTDKIYIFKDLKPAMVVEITNDDGSKTKSFVELLSDSSVITSSFADKTPDDVDPNTVPAGGLYRFADGNIYVIRIDSAGTRSWKSLAGGDSTWNDVVGGTI